MNTTMLQRQTMGLGKQLIVISTLIKSVVGYYDSALIFTVNNQTVGRNRLLVEQNSSQTLECWFTKLHYTHAYYLHLELHDKIIRGDTNTNHVSYHFPEMQCRDAGRYICYASIKGLDSMIDHSWVDIDMNCTNVHLNMLSLYVNDEEVQDLNHIIVDPGSNFHVRCAARTKEKPHSIYLLQNNIYIRTGNEYELQTNVSIKSCADVTKLLCAFNSPTKFKDPVSFVIYVSNCSVEIISFKYENKSDDYVGMHTAPVKEKKIRDDGKELFTVNKQMYNYLECSIEKNGRPTNLAIKFYNGTVITETELSDIGLLSNIIYAQMNCEDMGKITCELTDILSNTTYIKETYVWLSSCVPKLCHDQLDRKNISARLSSNAEVSFCFMMEGMGHSVTKQIIFKDARLLDENKKEKYLSEVTAVDDTLILNTFNFTVANVDLNDFGMYSINFLFGNGKKISFNFVLYNADRESSLPLTQNARFLTIGVPILLLSLFITLTFAICLTLKKFRLRICCLSMSRAQVVDKTEGDCVGRIKYRPLNKDQVHAASTNEVQGISL